METVSIPENKFVLCFNLKPHFLPEIENHRLTNESVSDPKEFLKPLLALIRIYDSGFLVS